MHSSLMERVSKGMKKRMPYDSEENKHLNSLVVDYTLNCIKHEWVGSETDQYIKRELLMTISYIYVTCSYSIISY